MKKVSQVIIAAFVLMTASNSCKNGTSNQQEVSTTIETKQAPPVPQTPIQNKALTAEEQQALTPDSVIQNFKEGNHRYMNNNLTERDHSALVRDAATAQFPKAVILSCLDSRVTVEDVFDQGIGDIFVCRVAGNFVNADILGSMEYGCKVMGAKLIVVLGHKYCGAIKAAIDKVQLGNITQMLAKIKPAVEKSQDFKGEKTSKNIDYVDYVTTNNVKLAIENIKLKSPILKEMADKGEIKMVGAIYDLNTGEVTFL